MKLGKYIYLFLVVILVIAFASCSKTTSQQQRDDEKILLSKYIDKFHKGAKPDSSGIYYFEIKKGTGDTILTGNYVKVFYRGYLIENNDTMGVQDGYEFDTSGYFEPYGFVVGAGTVVAGWDRAIRYMKQGGEAKWIIPSQNAYAGSATGSIPAYSTLVFYVTLQKVYRSTDTFKTIQKLPKYFLH